jgi:hypothetical protein
MLLYVLLGLKPVCVSSIANDVPKIGSKVKIILLSC